MLTPYMPTVILLWDHVLTLSMEIKYIWKPSARLTGSLFLVNRYFTLLANVIYSVSLFNESPFTPSVRIPLPVSLPATDFDETTFFRAAKLSSSSARYRYF
ncbi:hypothetical protein D9758_007935 [Tetrapyrgos nigripes]|uniref:DUF6533 domain-containing protein n=1 Tax=Tetrapyrgos nigripes TaxID=182062 RepID=A0A8H5D4A7_9AGAR|nr:hypothetical protein D9758_007935 [Tetrapyrgos nigripes]